MPKKRDVSGSRYKKSYASKGGESKSFLDTRDLDVSFLKPETKKMYKIMIIPYEIATDLHPEMDKGEIDYLLDVYIHRKIGINESDVLCPKFTYGKPCPICEEAEVLKEAGKEDEYKKIKHSRRVVYNVLKEGEKNIQLLHASHYLFEKELIETAMGYDEEEQIVPFASINDGKLIQFRVVKGSGGDWNEYKAFQFKERSEKYSAKFIDGMVDKAIALDTLIKLYSYDELKAIYYGESVEDEEEETEEESPREKRRKERKEKTKEEKPSKNKCPFDLRFGEDLDSEDVCSDCKEEHEKIYDACEKEWTKNHE